MYNSDISRFQAALKAEINCRIAEVQYRIEQATKDQNDKINAILEYLGADLEKVKPEIASYKVSKKKQTSD